MSTDSDSIEYTILLGSASISMFCAPSLPQFLMAMGFMAAVLWWWIFYKKYPTDDSEDGKE